MRLTVNFYHSNFKVVQLLQPDPWATPYNLVLTVITQHGVSDWYQVSNEEISNIKHDLEHGMSPRISVSKESLRQVVRESKWRELIIKNKVKQKTNIFSLMHTHT